MVRVWITTILAMAVLQSALPLSAGAKTDPLRCEAKKLRCQGSFFDCLARCDQRMESRPNASGEAARGTHSSCEAACEARHDKKRDGIQSRPPCTEVEPKPNRRQCEARYLSAEADLLICASRCAGREEQGVCLAGCQTRYETAVDVIGALPVCEDGRVSSGGSALLSNLY